MKLVITQSRPHSYLVPLRPRYFPQHPVWSITFQVLKLGRFGRLIRNALKCGGGGDEGDQLDRSVKIRYYIKLTRKGASYMQYKEVGLTGMFTCCIGTAF